MAFRLQKDILLPRQPVLNSENLQQSFMDLQEFNASLLVVLGDLADDLREDIPMIYGEIYVKDATTVHELSSAAHTQITSFSATPGVNGLSNGVTPDITNNHLTVNVKGNYFIAVSMSAGNDATQSHTIHVDMKKNNGATDFDNVHSHRLLTGGSGDRGSISLSGIVAAAKGDTLELWATSDDGTPRGVIFEDVTFTAIEVKQ